MTGGALSRVPMNGGTPTPVDRNIISADWSADGRLAIVRAADGASRLEFPPGTPLYKTSGTLSSVRFAPNDNRIAFIEHPVRHDNRGTVKVAEPNGQVRALSQEFAAAGGLAWRPSGREVWVTASRDSAPKSLWALTMGGQVTPVTRVAGAMTLRDIANDGRVLASRDTEQLEMAAIVSGEQATRNVSWLDWSRVADISDDGQTILFDESGVAAGPSTWCTSRGWTITQRCASEKAARWRSRRMASTRSRWAPKSARDSIFFRSTTEARWNFPRPASNTNGLATFLMANG